MDQNPKICPTCNNQPCNTCNGTGFIKPIKGKKTEKHDFYIHLEEKIKIALEKYKNLYTENEINRRIMLPSNDKDHLCGFCDGLDDKKSNCSKSRTRKFGIFNPDLL